VAAVRWEPLAQAKVGGSISTGNAAMRTALLSAAAALVLTSTYSVSSFAQHDDDTYRAPEGDGYRMHYRGDNVERSEGGQDNGDMDRGRDRWRHMGSMMSRGSGARFQFSRADAHIDIRCPQTESLQNCVQAATQLIDKVHSLTPGPSESRQGPAPSPDNH
jgi:hypothetical protein